MNNLFAKTMCIPLLICGVAVGQQPPVEMTDAMVVQMIQSKISSDLIILAISKCNPHFALDPSSTQYMLQMGVSDEIYKAMAARQNGRPVPGYTQSLPSATRPEASYTSQTAPERQTGQGRPTSKLSDADLFAGFNYASADFNGLIPRQNMVGWEGSSAVAFKKWTNTKLSAEGVTNGLYDTNNTYWASLHDYLFAGGVRVDSGPFFVHYLAGVSHLTASSGGLDLSVSQNALAMVIGGGIQVRIAGPLAFRTSVDYILTRHDVFAPDHQNNFRVGAGFVFRAGGGPHQKL